MRYEKPDFKLGGSKAHRLHERKEGLVEEATEHIPDLKYPKSNKHF